MAEATREKKTFMLWRLTHNTQGFDRDLLNIGIKENKTRASTMKWVETSLAGPRELLQIFHAVVEL